MIARLPFFYGWVMVAAAGMTMAFVYSMRYSFSVFYPVMLDEFGWSQAATSLAFSINIVVYGISAPIVGTMADRIGTRIVIPIGAAVILLTSLAMSQVGSIWQLYLFLGAMAFGIAAAGWAPHAAILPNWFVRNRGLALGLVSAGWGLSYLSASATEQLVSMMGWRWAYIVLGVVVASISGTLGYLFQRRAPEDYGLHPDGLLFDPTSTDSGDNGGGPASDALIVDPVWANFNWTAPTAVRTRRFWMLFLMVLFMGITFNMIALHLVRFMESVGYGRAFGALVLGLVGLLTIGGNLAGCISDRIGREATFTIGTVGVIFSALLLFLMKEPSLAWPAFAFAIFFGLSQGLAGTANGATVADIFQGPNFGSINGLSMTGFGIGGALGPWIGGFVVDVTGSYDIAFAIAIMAMAVACACIWVASPRKVRRVAGQASKASSTRVIAELD